MASKYSNQNIKHAIKRDEVREYATAGIAYAKAHLENVIIAVVAVLVVAFVVPYWMSNRAERSAKAATQLAEAQRIFAQNAGDEGGYGGAATAVEKYTQAQTRFRDIATNYAGSDTAVFAELGAVNCDLRLGALPKAEEGYRAFIAKHPGHLLASVAQAGLGYCLETAGKPKEAAEAFEAVAKLPASGNLGQSLLDAARNWRAAGDAAKAEAALKQLADASAGLYSPALVDQAKAMLKARPAKKGA